MTKRTTKADIYNVQDLINKALTTEQYSHRVSVEWAYGQPRAYLHPAGLPHNTYEELSPRLPTGEMYRWLWAYYKGLCLGLLIPEQD